MKERKGSIGEIGMIMIGAFILAFVMIIHALPMQKIASLNAVETTLSLQFNDEAGKISPLISSKTGSITYSEALTCELLGITKCQQKRDEIESVLKSMGASVTLYAKDRETVKLGETSTGDIIGVEIPMPNGRTEIIGVNVGISGISPYAGDWIWPTDVPMPGDYYMSHCYGEKRVKLDGVTPYTHSGIDIGGTRSDDIYAVADGKVVFVCDKDEREQTASELESEITGNCKGYGNNVIIKHDDFYVRYSHLGPDSGVLVDVGDRVEQGDVIGKMGNTGTSYGSHLDMKVYTYEPSVEGSGYDADIDPLCMYSTDYLDNVVMLKYAADDEDCDGVNVCSVFSKKLHSQDIEEDM